MAHVATAAVVGHNLAGAFDAEDSDRGAFYNVDSDPRSESTGASRSEPREEACRQKEVPAEKKRLPHQESIGQFYNSTTVQVLIACLIGANFLTNIVEKEIDPSGTKYEDVFQIFEHCYNVAFTIELGINLYAHWWFTFWRSGWNIFDVVVVAIGIITTFVTLPKAFSLLRMMRAFRVFRLFKRIKSLNKIIVAIVHAVPGVANAFMILTIVMCIYSILAVEFYKDLGEGCFSSDFGRQGFSTSRKYCMGEEYFGTFSNAFYTLFQVLTGESWCENVARPVIWFYEDKILSLGSALFFVSFMIVSSFVMANVVVAVLLEKMTGAGGEEEEDENVEAEADVAVKALDEPSSPPLGPTPELTEEDKRVARQLGTLQNTLFDLSSSAVDFQKDFDRAKSDMIEMREQIGLLVGAIERKYRLASL